MQLRRALPDWSPEQVKAALQEALKGTQQRDTKGHGVKGGTRNSQNQSETASSIEGHRRTQPEVEGFITYNQKKGQIGYKVLMPDGRKAILPNIRQKERGHLNGWYTFEWIREDLREADSR